MSWNENPAQFMDTGRVLVSRVGLSDRMLTGKKLPAPPGSIS
jgi:hypothetical protein